MPVRTSVYLTLSQVAARTGRHPELLRQWCAADRIPCERVGGSWVVLEADLPLLDRMATRARRRPRTSATASGARHLIAAVFDDPARAAEAADALRRRLSIDDGAIETGPIGTARLSALGVTVVAGTVAEGVALEARRILGAYGGRIVADVESDRTPRPGTGERGRRATGTSPGP